MSTKVNNFLEFNGHQMHYILIDGVWWVALKPICDALNVNYNRQFQNLKKDEILGAAFAVQQIQVPNDQRRKMVCLPEFYVYGWLFSIRSESEELKKFQWKCYEVLYDHFKGAITQRQQVLSERQLIDDEIRQLEEFLQNTTEGQKISELKKKKKSFTTKLTRLDKDLISLQGDLFNQS